MAAMPSWLPRGSMCSLKAREWTGCHSNRLLVSVWFSCLLTMVFRGCVSSLIFCESFHCGVGAGEGERGREGKGREGERMREGSGV